MNDSVESRNAIKNALAKLRDTDPERYDSHFLAGHQYLLDVRAGKRRNENPPVPREMLMAHSLLNDDPDGLLQYAIDAKEAREASDDSSRHGCVLPDGEVLFGGVDYDSSDWKWAYTFFAWDKTSLEKQPTFSNSPANPIEIPDDAMIAILGDWGGNNQAARQVAAAAKQVIAAEKPTKPVYFIHLGDVYYAGTNQSGLIEQDYQTDHFLDVWPGVAGNSFNLNSNHDMYAHGIGYYDTALKSPMFASQQGCGYFALQNNRFRIVGLDTAWFDHDRWGMGFMTGNLGPTGPDTQARFLHDQAKLADEANQKLILLTHHNGLTVDGKTQTPLWGQVMEQLKGISLNEVIWYWGHEHMGVVYEDQSSCGITVSPRCCGHGCIPWGIASDLDSPQVSWHEKKVLDGPDKDYFVANGFAILKLGETPLGETFYRQDGSSGWSS